MVLGDGIRRNIGHVDQAERDLLRDAIKQLNQKKYPGLPSESPPGGVSWWFKQDEIHQATHVHGGPEFLPWHRELINYFEGLIREINPDLSLHYWDFKDDPRSISGGPGGSPVNLFDANFMGSPGAQDTHAGEPRPASAIGDPWLSAGFYDPEAGQPGYPQNRDDSRNPADPPKLVGRPFNYPGLPPSPMPAAATLEAQILGLPAFGPGVPSNVSGDPSFEGMKPHFFRTALEDLHNSAHAYFSNVNQHIAFRDPFVYLLHSNVDRIFAMWQCDPMHPERLDPSTVYGSESNMSVHVVAGIMSDQNLNKLVEPFSTGVTELNGHPISVRPWEPTHENQGSPHDYHDLSVVTPPGYDTLPTIIKVQNAGGLINFNQVPQDETASRAAVFQISTCRALSLTVVPGSGPNAPYSVMNPPGTASVPGGAYRSYIRRIWFQFTGVAPGAAPNGSVTIHCAETNEDFTFSIHGESIARPKVAVMLVLDQSGSMDWLAGIDATTKRIDVLHLAAKNFCQLVQANNAVGIVSFDQTAYPRFDVTTLTGLPSDTNLDKMVKVIDDLQPQGATSIGNGIALGRNALNGPTVGGFQNKAMIVFTDGIENSPLSIHDVSGSLDAQTFAIGLGTAQQVSAPALDEITRHTGGSMYLSGPLSPSIDDQFRLRKYFLQVLAGVLNTSIVTDPSGTIFPRLVVRIPFQLSEADIDATAVLLTNRSGVRLLIETPAGHVMTPETAHGLGATFGAGTNMLYYRFTLPLALGQKPAQAGTWYAILQYRVLQGSSDDRPLETATANTDGIHYSFTAQAYTNIRMDARLSQNSLQPGAKVTITATLTEYGIPVDHRANVRAELELPDNTHATLVLSEVDPGRFQASTTAVIPGVYRIRVVASGVTMRSVAFTREQLLTATAILGGDNPLPTSSSSTAGHDQDLCKLMRCLLSHDSLGGFLERNNVNPKSVLGCVETWCKAKSALPTQEELAEREGTTKLHS